MDEKEPRTRDAERSRESLVKLARRMAEEAGLRNVNARELAEAAGMSHGNPTWLFGTTTGILAAVAYDGFQELLAELEVAIAEVRSTRACILAVAHAWMRFVIANPQTYRIMTDAEVGAALAGRRRPLPFRRSLRVTTTRSLDRTEYQLRELEHAKGRVFGLLVDIVIEGQRVGELRRGSPDILARALAALLDGASREVVDEQLGRSTDDRMAHVVDVVTLLLDGMQPAHG